MRIIPHSQIVTENIKKSQGEPVIYKKLLSSQDIEKILDLEKECERVEKQNGVINYKYSKLGILEKFIEEKLKNQLGQFTRHGGSYVITPEPFHVHTDTGKDDEMKDQRFPYKNILIPLMSSSEKAPLYTIIFKQRNFGQAAHFWRGEKFSDKKPTYNFKVTNYSDLEHFTDKGFDPDIHKKHLAHLPIESLYGLSIDQIIHWNVGDVVVFDCSSLHASNNFREYNIKKHGLTYFSSRDIK